MANQVEELGSSGEIMQVPPGEDISERLPLVTAVSGGHGNDADSKECRDGELIFMPKGK